MTKQNKSKIITVSFLLAGVVAAIVVDVILESLAATFGAVARVRDMDIVNHGLPITVGIITFAALQLNKKVTLWADEVVVEVSKVVWPTRKDTTAMTTVVCVMLLVAGAILGVFDFLSGSLIKMMMN